MLNRQLPKLLQKPVDGDGLKLAQQQGSVLRNHTVKSLTGNTVRTTQMGPKP